MDNLTVSVKGDELVRSVERLAGIGSCSTPSSVTFPDEGHGFTKTANRTRAAVETVRCFAKYP